MKREVDPMYVTMQDATCELREAIEANTLVTVVRKGPRTMMVFDVNDRANAFMDESMQSCVDMMLEVVQGIFNSYAKGTKVIISHPDGRITNVMEIKSGAVDETVIDESVIIKPEGTIQ